LVGSVSEKIRAVAADYASVADPSLRASVRARLLGLIEKLQLERAPLEIERIETARFQSDPVLRGGIRAHLDLAFRASSDPDELMAVATRGICRVAWHPDLESLPIAVALALPAERIPRDRAELFADDTTGLGAPLVVLFALATNPPRLGAAAALLGSLMDDCAELAPMPRLLAFTPLTGLRAELIRLVDDDEAWSARLAEHPDLDSETLRQQVRTALAADALTEPLPEPMRSWLAAAASRYAESPGFAAGQFHRSRGAENIGVCEGADPNDPDAMWVRVLFDYGQTQELERHKKRRHRPKSVPPE
jgi:hypothetical protein